MITTKMQNNYEPVPVSGCWLWLGGITPDGYGIVPCADGKNRRAHRVFYELIVGQIPKGLTIDHLCRVRCCVNPAHLEAVSQRENVARGICDAALNMKKTHCKRGHLLPKAVEVRGRMQRRCEVCFLAYLHAYYRNNKEKWVKRREKLEGLPA